MRSRTGALHETLVRATNRACEAWQYTRAVTISSRSTKLFVNDLLLGHRLGLLSPSAWNAARSTICRSLGHALSAEETITALSRELDQTYRTVARNLSLNPGARVEQVDGKDDLVVSPLDKLDEPDSLVKLREAVNARLPRVDLPEVLLEIAART